MNDKNNFLTIKKEVNTEYSSEKLTELISENWTKEFNIELYGGQEYKFLSTFSFGTLNLMGSPGAFDGIKLYSKFIASEKGNKIILYTKIRVEIYLFTILSIILPIVFYTNKDENFPIWSYFIMPLLIVFFGIVYRVQEIILIESVQEYFEKL